MQRDILQRIVLLIVLATSSLIEASEPILHRLNSTRQASETTVRVLLPDLVPKHDEPGLPVVYVLPVEAGDGTRWGNSLAEIQKHDLHNKHRVVCVFPTLSDLPWYADHPENPQLQQEAYLLQDVLPLVEKNYPVSKNRLLVGFSKSGWGAWSLLLRHPDLFHRAAAFDAPMMMDAPGKYGSGPIFGTVENFRKYRISSLLRERAVELKKDPSRLILIGQGNFHAEHEAIKLQLESAMIPFTFIADPVREHTWHSDWLPEAFEWLTI